MDSPNPDFSKLEQLWQWGAAAVTAGTAWVWHHTMGRIKELETGKVDKEDFNQYVARAEKRGDELRQATLSLFKATEENGKALARIEGKLDR